MRYTLKKIIYSMLMFQGCYSMELSNITPYIIPQELFFTTIFPYIYSPKGLSEKPPQDESLLRIQTLFRFSTTCKRHHALTTTYWNNLLNKISSIDDLCTIEEVLQNKQFPKNSPRNFLSPQIHARLALLKVITHQLGVHLYLSREDTAYTVYMILNVMKQHNYSINEQFTTQALDTHSPSYNRFLKMVPLIKACHQEKRELILLLLKYGANPKSQYMQNQINRPAKTETPIGIIRKKITVLLRSEKNDMPLSRKLTDLETILLAAIEHGK